MMLPLSMSMLDRSCGQSHQATRRHRLTVEDRLSMDRWGNEVIRACFYHLHATCSISHHRRRQHDRQCCHWFMAGLTMAYDLKHQSSLVYSKRACSLCRWLKLPGSSSALLRHYTGFLYLNSKVAFLACSSATNSCLNSKVALYSLLAKLSRHLSCCSKIQNSLWFVHVSHCCANRFLIHFLCTIFQCFVAIYRHFWWCLGLNTSDTSAPLIKFIFCWQWAPYEINCLLTYLL